jgi:alkyldihydroxyacetonephosphate synthase
MMMYVHLKVNAMPPGTALPASFPRAPLGSAHGLASGTVRSRRPGLQVSSVARPAFGPPLQEPQVPRSMPDVPALFANLAAIAGADQVRLSQHPTGDWWPLALKARLPDSLGRPSLIVAPGTPEETAAVLAACSTAGAPVTPFGAGSGVVGSAVPDSGSVLLDLRRLRTLGPIDRANCLVTAGAGVIGGELEAWLAGQGFTLGLYPQSLDLASVGGMVATRASGTYSGHYGAIEQRLAAVQVALADGTLCEIPVMPRWSLGPDLSSLFIGAEGTLGVVTAATLRIDRLPEARLLRALRFPNLRAGLDAIRAFVQAGLHPAVVRLYDEEESVHLRATTGHDGAGCILLLAFDGPEPLAALTETLAIGHCRAYGADDLDREPAERWNTVRLRVPSGFAALEHRGVMADFIDIQAPWDRVESVHAAVRAALLEHCSSAFAHFSHVYPQGTSIYFVIRIDADSDDDAVARYHRAWDAAMAATVASGGVIAHHHGIGLARSAWLRESLGSAWPIWERLKAAMDPAGILNPGKLGTPSSGSMTDA